MFRSFEHTRCRSRQTLRSQLPDSDSLQLIAAASHNQYPYRTNNRINLSNASSLLPISPSNHTCTSIALPRGAAFSEFIVRMRRNHWQRWFRSARANAFGGFAQHQELSKHFLSSQVPKISHTTLPFEVSGNTGVQRLAADINRTWRPQIGRHLRMTNQIILSSSD